MLLPDTHDAWLRAVWRCCSFFDQPGNKIGRSFILSFSATNLQAKILGNIACKWQQFKSGRMLKSHPLAQHLRTSINPHVTVISTSAAYIVKWRKLQFLSTNRGPNSTLCGTLEVFPTELSTELARIPLKVEFDPRTHKMHAHIQRSLAKAYSKSNDSAIVALFVQ